MPLSDDDSFHILMHADGTIKRVAARTTFEEHRSSFLCGNPSWYMLSPDVYMWSSPSSPFRINPAATALGKAALRRSHTEYIVPSGAINGAVVFTGKLTLHSPFGGDGSIAQISLADEARIAVFAKLAAKEIEDVELGIGRYSEI